MAPALACGQKRRWDLCYRHLVRLRQFAVIVAVLGSTSAAAADVTHVVARGHTLDAIAHRYHVTVKAIVDANHLRDPRHIRVGQSLVIPGVSAVAPIHSTTSAHGVVSYASRPRTPGVIHVKRIATAEEAVIRVGDRRGRIPPTALRTAEHVWRYPNGQTHPIDGRLLTLLGIVSNHFGSRRIDIISGFRPYSPTQYTAHSNHNVGHAVDFRVDGVPNEVVRDFCRTLHNVGVGYYPNSVFVHMDSRTSSAYWVDSSKPGEPPKYDSANPNVDEGTSDVADEMHVATPTTPTATPTDASTGTSQNTPPTTMGSDTTPANPVNH
jgi:uncharacterized protein YcbK (DUF882 family)